MGQQKRPNFERHLHCAGTPFILNLNALVGRHAGVVVLCLDFPIHLQASASDARKGSDFSAAATGLSQPGNAGPDVAVLIKL